MAYIHLIRHGQASSREQDYDKLTERGFEQLDLLAQHYLGNRIKVDYIGIGSLRRHRESAAEFRRVYSGAGKPTPEPVEFPELDEFTRDLWSQLVKEIIEQEEEFRKLSERWKEIRTTSERKAAFIFGKMTMRMMDLWVKGGYKSDSVESFAEFSARAPSVLDKIPDKKEDANILLFTSGTPIALMICTALKMEPDRALTFIKWLYNSSVTTLYKNRDRLELVSVNAAPHLGNHFARTLV